MEIYKDLSNPNSQEFEKLLNSQLSKVQIEEGKIIEGKVNNTTVVLFSATEFTIGTSDPNNTIAGFDVVKKGLTLVNTQAATSGITTTATTVNVSSTKGFPKEYGLFKIENEVITYTGITTNSFTGWIRGFSGITTYHEPN